LIFQKVWVDPGGDGGSHFVAINGKQQLTKVNRGRYKRKLANFGSAHLNRPQREVPNARGAGSEGTVGGLPGRPESAPGHSMRMLPGGRGRNGQRPFKSCNLASVFPASTMYCIHYPNVVIDVPRFRGSQLPMRCPTAYNTMEHCPDNLSALLAEIQTTWPAISADNLLLLGLRALRTLSVEAPIDAHIPKFTESELANEDWRPLDGAPGCFISNLGRIRGGLQNPQKIRKISCQTGGYAVVMLQGINGSMSVQVSRMVAIHFIRSPREGEVVNHLNGNKLDNRVGNLEWTSQKDNVRHSNDNGLRKRISRNMSMISAEQKREIRSLYRHMRKSVLANIYGIKSSEVVSIATQGE